MSDLRRLSYNIKQMKEIINFKLKEFLNQDPELIQEYIVALQYLKPIETVKEVFHLKLKHVEHIKQNLYSNQDSELIKIVARVQGLKLKEVFEMKIVEFFGIISSIKVQIDTIAKAEDNRLSPTEINFKWEAVEGDEKMSKFGIYNTLENLSGGDILKYKKIMNLPYSEVFTTLLMKKTASELQKQMDKIKTKQDV